MIKKAFINQFLAAIAVLVILTVSIYYLTPGLAISSKHRYIEAGSFNFQANTPERGQIYSTAINTASLFDYALKSSSINLNTNAYGNYIAFKDNERFVLTFNATEGIDCYSMSLNAYDEIAAKSAKQEIEKMKQIIKEKLKAVEGYFGNENC